MSIRKIIISIVLGFVIISIVFTGFDQWVINGLTDPLFEKNLNKVPQDFNRNVKGTIFCSTLINILDTEFKRPFGGYRPDNLIWFGGIIPLDNVENFQKGVIEVVQRTVIYLKERVSRAGGGSDEFDELLVKASESLNYKKSAILLTKWEFKDGIKYLKEYRKAINNDKSVFVIRTDSLYDLLRIYRELLGDTHRNLAKWSERDGASVSMFATDDYYYQALGVGYSVLALMRAAKTEFQEIFKNKGCHTFLEEMEKSISYALKSNPPWIILDGSVNAQFWPNHRSNLETPINDARFKIVSMMDNINR